MSTSSIVDRLRSLLASTPPFGQLSSSDRDGLLSDIAMQYYEAGEVVVEQGATVHRGLYIVESGLVRLMDLEQQRLLGKVGEGEVFGAFGLLKGGGAIYEAKAVEATVCGLLTTARFQDLYDSHPDFAAFFDNDIKQYVRRMGASMDVAGEHLLFSRPLGRFVHRELVSCGPADTARHAARLMRQHGVDAVAVVEDDATTGVVTAIDLRDRLVAKGLTPDIPVSRVMSSPVLTLTTEASLYDAIMMMMSRRIHHVVLLSADEGKRPLTVLSDRDIAHLRGQDPLATLGRVDSASTVLELSSIRADTHEQLLNLWRQGAQPEMLNSIMMEYYDRLAVRVLELVERELGAERGEERVDLAWAWMRLGSGGRQEMALNSQQHNALVYADPSSEEEAARAERWFDMIAARAGDALARCGFEPSGFVARDPQWRKSIRNWKKTYRQWILQADERALAPTPMFFDLRGVYGTIDLVEELKRDLVDALNVQEMDDQRTFLRLMAATALEKRPDTSLLRKFADRVGDNRSFNVRDDGVVPIVDAVRVLALEMRFLASTNTFNRLRCVAEGMADMADPVDDAFEAYQYLVDFRLESQLRAVEAGDPAVNTIEAASLTKMQQRLLRNAFSKATRLLDAVAQRYDLHRSWRL